MPRSRAPLTIGALTGALLLSGCTGPTPPAPGPTSPARTATTPSSTATTSPPAPTPSTSSGATPSGAPSSQAELQYLTDVQRLSSTLAASSPRTVLQLGRTTCAEFAKGRSTEQVLQALARDPAAAGFSGSEAAVVLGAAVSELCPQYRSRLQG